MKDWYVYKHRGVYYVVDTIDGIPVRPRQRATVRDVAQAVLRGKLRDI
jgi:hypothetical protein